MFSIKCLNCECPAASRHGLGLCVMGRINLNQLGSVCVCHHRRSDYARPWSLWDNETMPSHTSTVLIPAAQVSIEPITFSFRLLHFTAHSSWKVSDELGPKWPWYICLLMAQLEFTWWEISPGHWNIKLYHRIKPDNVASRKEFDRNKREPLVSHTNYLWFFSPPPL